MKTFLTTLLLLITSISQVVAQDIDLYQKKIYISNGDTLNYRVLFPENYDKMKKYPLVLFLHGAGERGNDNQSQLLHGGMMFTNPVVREKYPAIVLFPQCPKDLYWPFSKRPEVYPITNSNFPKDEEISQPLKLVKEMLESYIANEAVDKSRIYVTGISMGGMGTFDLACRYPELFAAAVPICGGVNVDRLPAIAKQMKFRIFHGDRDNVVPVENSRQAYITLKKAGAYVKLIEFPGIEHNSWTPAFNQPDFLKWMFRQKKLR